VLWPARLWPPLRIASSSPRSRASNTAWDTSVGFAARTITAGRWSNPPYGAGLVVGGVAGSDHPTIDGGIESLPHREGGGMGR
jgi:hypothetical protein